MLVVVCVTRFHTDRCGNRKSVTSSLGSIKKLRCCLLSYFQGIKRSVRNESQECVVVVQIVDASRSLRSLGLVQVSGNEKRPVLPEKATQIEDARMEAGGVLAALICEPLLRFLENLREIARHIRIDGHDTVEELVLVYFFDNASTKTLISAPGISVISEQWVCEFLARWEVLVLQDDGERMVRAPQRSSELLNSISSAGIHSQKKQAHERGSPPCRHLAPGRANAALRDVMKAPKMRMHRRPARS